MLALDYISAAEDFAELMSRCSSFECCIFNIMKTFIMQALNKAHSDAFVLVVRPRSKMPCVFAEAAQQNDDPL